jgi:2-haloalkanoic acid dehalogenase type II
MDITRQVGLIAFARIESAQQKEYPGMHYSEILCNVHRDIAGEFGMNTNPELDADFGQSVQHWPAFPDTADALRILKQYFKLAILSNISNDGFAASNRKLGVEFDAIYTAEDIGSYKPDPRNFSYMIENLSSDLGLNAGDVLHTAQSLFHDHVQAKEFGLANAWIDRQGLNESDNWGATAQLEQRPEFDFLFGSMAEMAEAVQRSSAQKG